MSNMFSDRNFVNLDLYSSYSSHKTEQRATFQRWAQRLAICLLIVFISLGIGLLNGSAAQALSLQQKGLSVFEGRQTEGILLAQNVGDNFVITAVNKAEAAVVQVNVSRSLAGNRSVPDFFRPFGGGGQSAPSNAPVLRGIGSGFVIDSSGLILTNAHVVNEADTVTVSFQDGRILEGQVLGKDPVTDVAVIQVQAEDLPTVTIGDSDAVQQGQWAIAIGNPLGLQETVTVGVISGTERSSAAIGIPDKRVGFIQTDAAINPGNSGGPLLNAAGDVIGINTAILQGTQGLGFAIPINTAQLVAQQLITTGQVQHPYIGVQMTALNPQVKEFINTSPDSGMQVKVEQGVLVVQVQRNSPAAKAGVRAGDVIQTIDDQPVTKASKVQQLIDRAGVGGKLPVKLQRNEQTVALTIEPEQLPPVVTR
ncbi:MULTISPECIES: HhoA/HhoB/HtrA family serine endopeptidase [unclassified Leptolyngbya]|uniref:HhoA/HhoB/HtrA family serine endopeptidase n=1 Tax=unclassified Leptolyngbya TaxID=2650499 RepID=UPI00168943A2|nr:MULTISPECIES: HhoA/HhoB/HtrA family serine endopeptidase [unclassified Leptolyngbya]MBD1909117.1 trypsin-like peptidase domain-containing protein [Leptolyngbya sp. FACHB-8]MBD2157490.1 trypsin-like peptidase domain-containing protein [Leptolyngbya sp. FACHB-16]